MPIDDVHLYWRICVCAAAILAAQSHPLPSTHKGNHGNSAFTDNRKYVQPTLVLGGEPSFELPTTRPSRCLYCFYILTWVPELSVWLYCSHRLQKSSPYSIPNSTWKNIKVTKLWNHILKWIKRYRTSGFQIFHFLLYLWEFYIMFLTLLNLLKIVIINFYVLR